MLRRYEVKTSKHGLTDLSIISRSPLECSSKSSQNIMKYRTKKKKMNEK